MIFIVEIMNPKLKDNIQFEDVYLFQSLQVEKAFKIRVLPKGHWVAWLQW